MVWKNKVLKLFFVFLFIMLFVITASSIGLAEKHLSTLEDNDNYFTKEQKNRIIDVMKNLPEKYQITILSKIDSTIELKAKEVFIEKQYSEDTIFILATVEKKEVYIMTGEALRKKGLDDPFFQKELEQYFVPNVKTGQIEQAFIQLTQGISKDLAEMLQVKMDKKDPPKIPEAPKNVSEDSQSFAWQNSRYLLMVGILISIGITLLLHKQRKNPRN